MIRLQVQNLSKTYRRGREPAVKDVSFEIPEGDLLSLVGASGSGKTTLLRLIAGLERPDAGDIRLDARIISCPKGVCPPEERGIGLVFQHQALFPHLTVERNIAFGLRHLDAGERAAVVAPLLELVGLSHLGKRYPHELAGGERQRVALARALAPSPRLLLLDEPFSSLDARLRQAVRDETRAILKARGATALFVTHETGDALSIADRIVVLRQGAVQQDGVPSEVYYAPANAYVASFFGACNFLPVNSLPHPSGARIRCQVGPPALSRGPNPGGEGPGFGIWVRPEDLELVSPENTGALTGSVVKVGFHGAYLEVTLLCEHEAGESFEVIVWHHGPFMVRPGETWAVAPLPQRPRPL
ncbi:MAG TPA: ABC transporter ATP-binding protein [Verrucomicrobiales bacterium]|nr:ABC transporter ATP-binding protein [Verrucomicrobiales bacterium]